MTINTVCYILQNDAGILHIGQKDNRSDVGVSTVSRNYRHLHVPNQF